jgi:hypothetical protein
MGNVRTSEMYHRVRLAKCVSDLARLPYSAGQVGNDWTPGQPVAKLGLLK